jgi:ABC-type nitrate/sulfonate/bicarbonate transport system permease component
MAGLDSTTLIGGPRRVPVAAWRRMMRLGGLHSAGQWLVIVAFLLGWELVARTGAVSSYLLPPFSVVVERIWSDLVSGDLVLYLALTVYRSLLSFAIAAFAGIVLALAMTGSRAVRWFFDPVISVAFPMPKIAFLPIVVLWLGFHDLSKVTMATIDAFFPVVTATLMGIQGVDRYLVWSARNMGASDREVFVQILVPAALPQIITGLQVSLPIAVIVTIVAEMLTGGVGLGAAMVNASRYADSPGVFAGIVEIGVVGLALIKAMSMVRRRLLSWHQEEKGVTTV